MRKSEDILMCNLFNIFYCSLCSPNLLQYGQINLLRVFNIVFATVLANRSRVLEKTPHIILVGNGVDLFECENVN